MLRNKTNQGSYPQDNKGNNSGSSPSRMDLRLGEQLVFVPELLPVAANDVCGDAAITAGQIPWSHEAIADETAFGEMFSFAFVCEESRVSRGGWGSPSSNNLILSLQREGVFCINTSNRTPVQSRDPKDVVNYNFRFGYSNAGIPKQQPREKTKPNVNPNLGEKNCNWLSGKSKDSKCRKSHGHNCHDLARAGSKKLRIHTISFTQSAPEVGAAL